MEGTRLLSPISPGTRQLPPALASAEASSEFQDHLWNAGLSGECQGWGTGGEAVEGLGGAQQLLTFWLQPRHCGSWPSGKHHC